MNRFSIFWIILSWQFSLFPLPPSNSTRKWSARPRAKVPLSIKLNIKATDNKVLVTNNNPAIPIFIVFSSSCTLAHGFSLSFGLWVDKTSSDRQLFFYRNRNWSFNLNNLESLKLHKVCNIRWTNLKSSFCFQITNIYIYIEHHRCVFLQLDFSTIFLRCGYCPL